MRRAMICHIVFLIIWISGITQELKFAGIRAYTENDFLSFIGKNRDDNYTGGVKFEFITNLFSPIFSGRILNPMKWSPVSQSISFSVTAFTPQDLALETIDYCQRPYASYQSWNLGAAFLKEKNSFSYELSIGAMGKSLAGDAQKKIHGEHWFGSTRPIPQGWQYQIANGGALAVNLRLHYEHRLLPLQEASADFRWLSATWLHELNLGQYMINYLQGLRIYLFNYHHPLPSDYDLPVINAFHRDEVYKKFSFFCFITPRLKAVIHNATLTGKLLGKSSVYTLPQSDINNAVLEYDGGMQIRFCSFTIGYNFFGRSREYKNEEQYFHNWGGFYLAATARWK
ncbi:MAG TPA: lipid A-modifier LpxR family protein [Puia sp.]|nr:lipid A-modifier LpxR family protein [Puia sp.]